MVKKVNKIHLTESELRNVIYKSLHEAFSGSRDFEMETCIEVQFPENIVPDDEIYDNMYLGDDINVTITFTYTPGQPQTYYNEGRSAEYDIKTVKVNPHEITDRNLTPEMVDYIENDMLDELNNDSQIQDQMENFVNDDEDPYDFYDDDYDRMDEECEDGECCQPAKKHIRISEGSDGYDAYRIFRDCGWAFSEATDVISKSTGAKGVRYTLDKDTKNPCSLDALKAKLESAFGKGKVIVSTAQYRYAPEITHPSVIILN